VSTELQPADDLAVLAATALIHAHHLSVIEASKEGSTVESANTLHAPLFDTLVLLEQTVTTSRWAYTPRLILTRLYRLLAAPSLAMQHYGLANLKSIQFDTLSHHVLSRASTFSLGCIGDLTLVNECVESSQIYSVNGVDVSVYSEFHIC
jgi:N-terminal acetyltransferase B complex non-catalytic subunit